MATKGPITQCPGFSSYTLFDDGHIELDGQAVGYDLASGTVSRMKANWDKYGPWMMDAATSSGLPVAWMMGILTIESGGDPNACAPCVATLNGKQWCSLAPDHCGGDCCAYGLTQFTDSTAKSESGGQITGPMLLGRPDLSIALLAKFFAKLVAMSDGDPIVAAKRYNGCGECKGGQAPCNGEGAIGIGGQNDYCVGFIKAANTFVALNLPKPQPTTPEVPGVPQNMTDLLHNPKVGVFVMSALAMIVLDQAFGITKKLNLWAGSKL